MRKKLTFLGLIAEIDNLRKELEFRICPKDSFINYHHRVLAVQKLKEAIQHLNDEVNETLVLGEE